MNVTIRPENKSEFDAIDVLVTNSFKYGTPYSDGTAEINLIHEIRSKQYYIPELSFVTECDNKIVGHFMLSHFPLSQSPDYSNYDKAQIKTDVLMLTPVAVKIDCLRKGIGTSMLLQGIKWAKQLGYKAIIVEGNPAFYNTLGFVSSYKCNVFPANSTSLPSPDCLMIQMLGNQKFDSKYYVEYSMYDTIYHP